MSRGLCGYADLLRIMQHDASLLPVAAEMLGFVPKPITVHEIDVRYDLELSDSVSTDVAMVTATVADSSGWPNDALPSQWWLPVRYTSIAAAETPLPPRDKPLKETWKDANTHPVRRPLAPWKELLPRVRKELLGRTVGSRVDMERVVRKVARAELLHHVPRQTQRRWGSRVQLILDWSQHLIPFLDDQRDVQRQLAQIYGPANVDVVVYDESCDQLCARDLTGRRIPYRIPESPVPIVVLSDFGALLHDAAPLSDCWRRWAVQVVEHAACVLAVVPCHPRRIPPSIRAAARVLSWQTPAHYAGYESAERRAACVEQLLAALTHTAVIEPGLLRDMRNDVCGYADASLEADFWSDGRLLSRHPSGAAIDPEVAGEELAPRFARLPAEQRRRALSKIREWRHGWSDEVWVSEIWKMDAAARACVPEDDLQIADDRMVNTTARLHASRESVGLAERAWVAGASDRIPSSVRVANPQLRRLYRLAHPEARDDFLPGEHPSEIPPGGTRETLRLCQQGNELVLIPPDATAPPLGFVGLLETTNRWIDCVPVVAPPDKNAFWKSGRPPAWAKDWGRDQYGAWATFEVDAVRQRLRWMPPGTFRMGSPESEEGRHSDEGPLHDVTLTRGFWLFDTLVTQELRQAVMGENSNRFYGARRPVDSVSWDYAQRFLKTLNQRYGETIFALPTEAQWEYACRAGTTTAYSFGDDPALLDDYAWYALNAQSTTHVVAAKRPNPWGLYDMYGNVWEWCQDFWGDYKADGAVDLTGPKNGSYRVLRGGSWDSSARYVRSASRIPNDPGNRSYNVGFRCAQVLGMAEPAEEAGAAAEPPAGPTNAGGATGVRADGPERVQLAIPSDPIIVVRSDVAELELHQTAPPAWASAIGRDRYGLWAELTIDPAEFRKKRQVLKLLNQSSRRRGLTLKLPKPRRSIVQRMRWIPPGQFLMGMEGPDHNMSESTEELEFTENDSWSQEQVTISRGFWLFDTPITQALWQVVMGDNPSHFEGDDRPVENVSWNDCQKFVDRLAFKFSAGDFVLGLSTEDEWEYACRAGTTTLYSFGDEISPLMANYSPSGLKGTSTVRTFEPNPWGLYDMHGNVYEWCEGPYSGWYSGHNRTMPAHVRPMRGGCWCELAEGLHSSYRSEDHPDYRSDTLGFRCALVHKSVRSTSANA